MSLLDFACKPSRHHPRSWEKVPDLLLVLLHTLLTWDLIHCICFLYLSSSSVKQPSSFFWIHKELLLIMNRLLNYWLLFTSLLFTVLYPTLLSEVHYLSCIHLFGYSFIQGLLLLSLHLNQTVSLSPGKRWEDWKKVLLAHTSACVHLTCVPECNL